jgi:hypothetical protein
VLIATFDGLLIHWLLNPQRSPEGHLRAHAIEQLGRGAVMPI